jgi:hypothetical protein
MTRTEILRLIGAAGWLFAIAMIAAERRIIRRLNRHGAADPASAVPLEVRWPLTRFRLARLQKAGAVVSAGAERYYLSAAGYSSYRQVRRRRVLTVLAIALPLILTLFWLTMPARAS